MQSLFGLSLSPVVTYVIAVVIIVGLLALFAVVLPRIVGGRMRLSGPTGRTRQPRLGIVDIYDLDRQRQLVLLRRDNVEHLLLIGGPNDVLVESAIVRGPARAAQAQGPQAVENGERQQFAPAVAPVPATSFQELETAVAAAVAPMPAPAIRPVAEPAPEPAEAVPTRPEPYVRGSAMPTFPVRPPSRPADPERPDLDARSAAPEPVFPPPSPVRPPLTQEIPRANLRPAEPAATPAAAPVPSAIESARASVARGFGSLFGRAASGADKPAEAPLPERSQPRFEDLLAKTDLPRSEEKAAAVADEDFDEPAADEQPEFPAPRTEVPAREVPARDEVAPKRAPSEFSIPDDIARKLEEALQKPYAPAAKTTDTPVDAAPMGPPAPSAEPVPERHEPFPAASSPFPPEEAASPFPADRHQPAAAERPASPAKPVEQKPAEVPAAPKPAAEEPADPFSVEAIEAEFARLLGRSAPPKSGS